MSTGIVASQAFSPNKLADLVLWLDASDIATIIESGGAVSEWATKSMGNNVNQIIGSQQPLTGVNTLNGKNVIAFDGDDDNLENGSFTSSVNTTIFITSKVIAVTTDSFDTILTMNGGGDFQIEAGSTTMFRARFFGSGLGIGSAPIHASDLVGIPSIINYRLSANDLDIILRVNGAQSDEDTYDGTLGPAPQALFLAQNRSSNRWLEVDMGEVIIYNRDLTLSEMVGVENYSANKWGVSLVFPLVFSSDFSEDFS